MTPGPSHASHPPPGGPPDPRQQQTHDQDIAAIFRDMRRACQLSREQLAVRLSTPVRTIEALEEGAVLSLPEWPETSRVILAYTAMLGLDGQPILRRIQAGLRPPASEPAAPETAAEAQPLVADRRMAPRSEEPEDAPAYPRRRRVLPWALLLVILAATAGLVLALQRPQLVTPVIDQMPDSLARLARTGLELLQPSGTAPDAGGEAADDPRSRKADKLPQAGAPDR